MLATICFDKVAHAIADIHLLVSLRLVRLAMVKRLRRRKYDGRELMTVLFP